jgi:hypothetical protein
MQELTVDLSDAYAKPLSTEVLEAADVVVTMGRSVGSVEIPASTRHVDWRVGDPTGASVDEARPVRDDIDRRVQVLLAALDPPEKDSPEARVLEKPPLVRVLVLPPGAGLGGLRFRRSIEQEAEVRRDERVGRHHRVRVVDGAVLAREGDPARVLA